MFLDLFNIDGRTLIAVLFWGNITSVVVNVSYQFTSNNVRDDQLVRRLVLAKLFQAFSYLGLFYRGLIPDIISVNIGNTLLFIGFYFEAYSIFSIIEISNRLLFRITKIILALSILVFNGIELYTHEVSYRVPMASIVVFSLLLLPSIKLIVSSGVSRFKRVIGVVYIIFIVLLLPRAFYTLLTKGADLFTNALINTLTYLVLVLMMIFSLSAFLLLMKEKSDKVIKLMATTDSLTGMANRFSFFEAARSIFNRHKGGNQELTFLFLDIDHFKKINDKYGHTFGDNILIIFAGIIESNLRKSDLSCRYGGEEFVAMMTQIKANEGRRIAEAIMKDISEVTFEEYPDFHFTTSIGIVNGIPGRTASLSQYIDYADQALYAAKNAGRNRIIEYNYENDCRIELQSSK